MTGSLQVKNEKYYIVLNTYENGKRKPKWIATGLEVKGNKRRAEQMLRDAEQEYENSLHERGSKANTILYSDYVRHYLSISEKRVDAVTMQSYRVLAERHIIPYFAERQTTLADVSRNMLQAFLDEKSRNGRLDGKGGLSPKSVREIKNLLHQSFNEAIREELIETNPCTLLILPKANRPEAKFYTAEQLNALLAAVKDEPLYPVIRTAIVYGLRRSEILGLKWDSIDFENGSLTVKHTVVRVTETVEKDTTKTKSSRRSFPLLPEMADMFRSIKAEQETNQKLLGKAYTKTEYVFCWPDGRPFSPDYVTQKFSDLLQKHGFPHIRFHELRHSCASLLINQNCSLKEVQEWMGHSEISVTADIYGHLETSRKVGMAAKMSNCING